MTFFLSYLITMNIYQAFMKYLDIKGIAYTTKDNILIQFSYNNWNFAMFYDEDDENYFRLTLPKIGHINKEEGSQLVKALMLSAEFKVVKMVIIEEEFWLTYEQHQYDSINTKLFDRSIRALSQMAQEWRNRNKTSEGVIKE